MSSQSVCLLTFITWIQRLGQEGLVSFLAADVGDKGRLIPSGSSLQVSAFGAGVLYRQFLVTLWLKEDLVPSDNTPSKRVQFWRVNLPGRVDWSGGMGVAVVGGWITFYLKQTWLTNGDWPHCGRTSERLVIWLFHVQNAANLRSLWTQLIKRNRLWWILVSFAVWDCLSPQ